MADEWEKQESVGAIWLPTEEGSELIGVVEEVVEGTYGRQYVITDADGNTHRTPSHKVLQNRMAKVEASNQVKLVYTGQEAPSVKGQNPTKLYDVFIKKA